LSEKGVSYRAVVWRTANLVFGLLLTAGCVSTAVVRDVPHANHSAPLATDVDSCAGLINGFDEQLNPQPVQREFSVAVWNAQKVAGSPWRDDLSWLTDEYDLVLVQEFALAADWQAEGFLSFAPGFGTREAITGVATVSRVEPIVHCQFEATEPMLRTRKATIITSFMMENGVPLVVVNLHAVNFALGLVNFRTQLTQAVEAVAGHRGPLIVSGDFNTWRAGRVAIKEQLLTQLDLQPVAFEADERKKVFGQYLDHIYVRGLKIVEATTSILEVSDHNPMFVRLEQMP
jgi:endonuclease/exonuclease/phosphatase (EEP) superfamily protein YafD